ncbi:Piso0_001349 [Millerozyma farinosa CBS 7064]|uniref:Piso0_001349 protein n=1 Tax=Pichia sorbitophila (strain ATCC MYA-4447 / BCRC 22081 / CBS 7064 / NBRC 10061 / NRRL Y-12695) TaxID=559304 RepID=G8YMX7_PICSO|nr:Piso0_001349 [Millerozyma farinosa CBS 7064]
MLHRKSVAAGLQDLPYSQETFNTPTNSSFICENSRNENDYDTNTRGLVDNSIEFALSSSWKLYMIFQPSEKVTSIPVFHEFEHTAKHLVDKETRDKSPSAEKRIYLLMSSDQIIQVAGYFRPTSKIECVADHGQERHSRINDLNTVNTQANTYCVHLQKQSVGSWIVVFPQTQSVAILSFHLTWIYTVLQTYRAIEFALTIRDFFDLQRSCADMKLNVKLKGSHSAFGYRALIMMGGPVSVTILQALISKCALSPTAFQCSPSPIGWRRPVYKLKPDKPSSSTDLIEQEPSNEKNTISKLIRLRKSEVSFLLGLQGHRLNHIRRTTGCAIKTMPIEAPGLNSTFLPIRNASQNLLLCGAYENVNAAVELINSYLVTHRQNSTFW